MSDYVDCKHVFRAGEPRGYHKERSIKFGNDDYCRIHECEHRQTSSVNTCIGKVDYRECGKRYCDKHETNTKKTAKKQAERAANARNVEPGPAAQDEQPVQVPQVERAEDEIRGRGMPQEELPYDEIERGRGLALDRRDDELKHGFQAQEELASEDEIYEYGEQCSQLAQDEVVAAPALPVDIAQPPFQVQLICVSKSFTRDGSLSEFALTSWEQYAHMLANGFDFPPRRTDLQTRVIEIPRPTDLANVGRIHIWIQTHNVGTISNTSLFEGQFDAETFFPQQIANMYADAVFDAAFGLASTLQKSHDFLGVRQSGSCFSIHVHALAKMPTSFVMHSLTLPPSSPLLDHSRLHALSLSPLRNRSRSPGVWQSPMPVASSPPPSSALLSMNMLSPVRCFLYGADSPNLDFQ